MPMCKVIGINNIFVAEQTELQQNPETGSVAPPDSKGTLTSVLYSDVSAASVICLLCYVHHSTAA